MTAMELKLSLMQEVSTFPDDEQVIKKAIASLRRLKANSLAKREAKAKEDDEDREPTKEEILAGIKEGLQAIKDRREGKDVTGVFRDAWEVLNEL